MWQSCMKTDSLRDQEVALDALMPLIRERLAAGQSVQFSPRGTSMLPMLRQGIDRVTLSPLPEKLRRFDIPLYRRSSGKYVLHRIVSVADTLTCVGDNQFDLETGLHREQLIGIVTAFTRGDKKYTVDYLPYRVYCHLWHYSRPVRRLWRNAKRFLRRHWK